MTPTLTRYGYELDGQRLPRVSTILQTLAKPSLEAWKRKVGEDEAARVSKTATELGTRIHEGTEHYDRYGRTSMPVDLQPYLDAYWDWRAQYVAEVVSIEQVVWSPTLRYAGTLDRLYRFHDGRLMLADGVT